MIWGSDECYVCTIFDKDNLQKYNGAKDLLNNNIDTIESIFNNDENRKTLKNIYKVIRKYRHSDRLAEGSIFLFWISNSSEKVLKDELLKIWSKNKKFDSDIKDKILKFCDIEFSYDIEDNYF